MHLIDHWKGFLAVMVSIVGGFSDFVFGAQSLAEIDLWIGILAKLIGAIAGLYSIYEFRRKRKKNESDFTKKG